MGLKITNRTETIAADGSGAVDLNLDSTGGGNVQLDGQPFPNAIGSENDLLTVVSVFCQSSVLSIQIVPSNL